MTTDSTTADIFDTSVIGRWSEPETYEVTRERIAAYAAATNETLPTFLAGDQAPPVFAVVPAFTQFATMAMEPVPMHLMLKILHGEQDIRIHRPIVPGDVLSTRASVVGIHGKATGVVVNVRTETRDAQDELVNEQYFAGFFRGGIWPNQEGTPFPAHELDPELAGIEPLAVVDQAYDADQTHRYAEAAGDPMPIHTDDEFARSMGLPGIIVHGLCTMAFVTRAVVANACGGDPSRLERIAVRFGAVGFPSDRPSTQIWRSSPTTYAFQTTAADRVLIKDGLAEVRA